MNNPTFLATVQQLGSEELEWLESSNFRNANEFAKALDQEGYIVKQIIAEDSYKMW